MNDIAHALPKYLRRYCVTQDYDRYTAQDHAAWRFIMRENVRFFKTHAVPVYWEGITATGMSLERIPRIEEMNEALSRFGWGAVAICGFIPPAAFLEFQSRNILPIAADMRTMSHLTYTPAPDIVHEAAGHAPIIADAEYRTYLQRYAKVAQYAIMSRHDLETYEAIRYLSDVKEQIGADPAEIVGAEAALQAVSAAQSGEVSEATQVSRMAWWTVEYGLVGPLHAPKIYGAGLLSSLFESQNCLSDKVKKIPLSLECIETSYDITKPQPQLFVARSFAELTEVLEALEKRLAFSVGGLVGLERALQADSVNTVVLDSGLTLSGRLDSYVAQDERIHLIKMAGPVQLSHEGRELLGHGREKHSLGFSTMLGRLSAAPHQPMSHLSDDQLHALGIRRGRVVNLTLVNGYQVSGLVKGWQRLAGKLAVVTLLQCTARKSDGEICYLPEWGEFDWALGESVISVHGGPADKESYGEYGMGHASSSPSRKTPLTDAEWSLFADYQALFCARSADALPADALLDTYVQRYCQNHPNEWLLGLETLELLLRIEPRLPLNPLAQKVHAHLNAQSHTQSAEIRNLTQRAIHHLSKEPTS